MEQCLQSLIALALGFLSHWGFFIRGEHDLDAAAIARFHLLLTFVVIYFKYQHNGFGLYNAVAQTAGLLAIYCATLLTSIACFRMSPRLSPWGHIPGPSLFRPPKLTHMWQMANRRNCEILDGLNHQYGDVVRTGPSEVTVFGLEAYNQVHSPESKCSRAAYYDIIQPMVSLDTTRDEQVHTYRRKVWDQAFSIKALERSESIVYSCVAELASQLQRREGETLDISAWLEFYTFDVMGLFGLTINFKNLTQGEHPILKLYHKAHYLLGPLAAVPWLKHLIMGIPFVERIKYYKTFFSWAHSELERNIQNNRGKRQNIIGYVLTDAEENGGVKANWKFVLGDFVLVIIAGSDPVRQVLANMIYYLIRNPSHLEKIRSELASIDICDYKALQHQHHLNAAIYETLRLHPAVPSASLRLSPKGGITINGVYIPENTTIATPQYSLMRDPRYFIRPNEWIPKRFTTRPDLVIDKNAFGPWGIGKKSCLGRNLSLMEIRVAAALLLTGFDFHLAPGEDGTSMFREATDFFTTTPGPPRPVVKV